MPTNEKKLDGRYLIRREIGSGGFGAVYLAQDTRFGGNNRVAIKKIVSTSRLITDSFRQEADLLYNLSHPNLPKVTNCFQEDGASFIVMDFITGEDLAEKLKKGRRFSVGEVLDIADTVLDALEYLHSAAIFHRDIKPHNIKIDETGKVFLLDFGTAKGTFDEGAITHKLEQSVVGYTPFYAPLEQILRVDTNSYLLLQSTDSPHLDAFLEMKTDARSDIYSLGATVYHLLTNFSPEKATATVRAHLIWSGKQEPLPDCRSLNPEISDGLAKIIERSLEILPANRFQTARELRLALKNQGEMLFASGTQDKTALIGAEHIPIQKPSRVQIPVGSNPVLPTQPSRNGVTSEVSAQKSVPTEFAEDTAPPAPIESFFPSEIKSNKRTGAKFFIFAGLGIFLFVLFGAGGFVAVRYFNLLPGAKEEPRPEKTADTSASEAGTSAETPAKYSMEYSLLVQKMRDGAKYQEPFESSGQEIFENGYRFQLRFAPPEDGFLYVFAEGLNERGEKVFNMIFPTPKANGGKANVSARQEYESGWNEFGGQAGTENIWLIWSNQSFETVEKSGENAFANDGKVTDKDLSEKLQHFLRINQSRIKAGKDTEKKLSRIEFEEDRLVYLIQLEHR